MTSGLMQFKIKCKYITNDCEIIVYVKYQAIYWNNQHISLRIDANVNVLMITIKKCIPINFQLDYDQIIISWQKTAYFVTYF